MFRELLLSAVLATPLLAQLDDAYAHLNAKRYDDAARAFESALAANPTLTGKPTQPNARLDYAYLLLRMGETEQARQQIEVVLAQAPNEKLTLELAYLFYETNRRPQAFELFLRLKSASDASIRAQATQTFTRLDEELQISIARWQQALQQTPSSYSAHEEIARLYEERNDWLAAATHYRLALTHRPAKRSYLLDIARVEDQALRPDFAFAARLAASRPPLNQQEPRLAELAREQLPTRYPFVYEFEFAIQLDPLNTNLRRELGFLHLAMRHDKQATQVFEELLRLDPEDSLATTQLAFLKNARGNDAAARPLLERAAQKGESGLTATKELANQSFEKGYLKDALSYLQTLQESTPEDFEIMLRLGWTHNMLHQDQKAIHWFDLARQSPDPKIAAEADRAYRNLRPSLAPVRLTAWVLPFFSSRWHEAFTYGQAKLEFRLPFTKIRPYFSARMIGDLQNASQPLSERALIFAVGIASPRWKGLMAWGEAGEAWSYFRQDKSRPLLKPDYRLGLNFSKNLGQAGLGGEGGPFLAHTSDGIFISRFQNNTMVYLQNRAGYSLRQLPVQLYFNFNLTFDLRRLYWANFAEIGPGLRLRLPGSPAGLYFFADLVKGRNLVTQDNPRPANYTDLRAGLWYAFTY
jgi:tetratricopeptide (TPR) repeat protein